jgi:hypothetical protein
MPQQMLERHQAVCDAFGASANPWFQAVQDSQHRDTDVLMLYPLSLVACEERFGSWMVQYGYANYVTPRKLLEHGRVMDEGLIEMAGRSFGTLAVLFEPFPPAGLLDLIKKFVEHGGKLIWSGPPARFDFAGNNVLGDWQTLFGIKSRHFGIEGLFAGGKQIQFSGALKSVPPQFVLTDFLVDLIYPVEPDDSTGTVATIGKQTVGTHREFPKDGSATFLGFRPRDDQSASLGYETRSWFEILLALGAYPKRGTSAPTNDNPDVVSRSTPYAACRFPNGTTAVAAHYRSCEESWPGGFHRDSKQDDEILAKNPLPSSGLDLRDFWVNGHRVTYEGSLVMAFLLNTAGALLAFAGHDCRQITIDGHEFVFAKNPLALVGWAPVLPERCVTGGAVMELWVQGESELQVPLPPGFKKGQLLFQGVTPGSLGERVESTCYNGLLQFKSSQQWGQRHLFLLG